MNRYLRNLVLFCVSNLIATLVVVAFIVGSYVANVDSLLFGLNVGKFFVRLAKLLDSDTFWIKLLQYLISVVIVAYVYRGVERRVLHGTKLSGATAYLLLAPLFLALVAFGFIVFLEGDIASAYAPEQADIVLFVFILQSILSFIIGLRLIVQLRKDTYEAESKQFQKF